MSEKNSTQDISDKPREYVLETTQEQYDEMKARGIDEEAIPSVGKHIFRRRTRKIEPREAKIKMTMFIDGDILQHFKKRAEAPNAAPYQTQINQELRAAMERGLLEESDNLDAVVERLANNQTFINAVSERLKAA
ncbi:MAG: BrnA antitoxin family protein [Pyrinomonadaceae bacterium]